MQTGYIYILKNQYMNGLLKIGFTTRMPADRVKELSGHTGVPGKFSLVKSWEVDDPAHVEQVIFASLHQYRAEGEFFAISEDEAQEKIVKTLQKLGQADSAGLTIPQKQRENFRLQKEQEIQAKKQRIKNCKESWVANLQNTRASVKDLVEKKIGYSYSEIQDQLKKTKLPESITNPALFLTLGLSLILETKIQDKMGRQKWIDLDHKWHSIFEDEMQKRKELWSDNKGVDRPVRGVFESYSFYSDPGLKW